MCSYFLGVYKHDKPFPEDAIDTVLKLVETHIPEFFPATMDVDVDSKVKFKNSSSFDLGLVPTGYWIEPGQSVRIPLIGSNGMEVVIIDDKKPEFIPTSVIISWADKSKLPITEVLEKLLSDLANALEADYGYVTDEDTRYDDEIVDRLYEINIIRVPLALFWINWLGPEQVKSVERNLGNLSILDINVRKAGAGVLISLQSNPISFKEKQGHTKMKEAEKLIGLQEIQAHN